MAVDRSSEHFESRDNYREGYEQGKDGNVLDDAVQGALEDLQDEDYAQGYTDGEHDRTS